MKILTHALGPEEAEFKECAKMINFTILITLCCFISTDWVQWMHIITTKLSIQVVGCIWLQLNLFFLNLPSFTVIESYSTLSLFSFPLFPVKCQAAAVSKYGENITSCIKNVSCQYT